MKRLSDVQRRAIRVGSLEEWRGHLEVDVPGDTMAALARRGLAEVRTSREPYVRCVYRLTSAGNALRVEWAIDEATKPIVHTPIPVRCTHCGREFPDGTPGGSCACGLPVERIDDEVLA